MIKRIYTANREEWLALRRGYIGGSDAAAVVGLSPYVTPYQVWAEKTGKVPPFAGNLATEVGTYLEDFVAQLWSRETGRAVRRNNASLVNDLYPWAIADVDRMVVGADEGLEIKTTSALATKRFADGDYPPQYYVQCMHYLAVTGAARWHLAVLIGNSDFRTYVIERNEDEIGALMEAERAMMDRIERDDPPPAQDGDNATLAEVYPREREDEAPVDVTGIEAALDEYTELSGRIKALEDERSAAGARIKAFLKDAGRGESERFRVSWVTSERSTFDAKAFAKANPGVDLTPYYKTTTARTLRVNPKNL